MRGFSAPPLRLSDARLNHYDGLNQGAMLADIHRVSEGVTAITHHLPLVIISRNSALEDDGACLVQQLCGDGDGLRQSVEGRKLDTHT
jgi:hypothetical protein